MDKYYKKLMNSRKSTVARLLDSLLILILVMAISFCFTLVKFESFVGSLVITGNIAVVAILLMWKIDKTQLNKFKKTLNKEIKNKLILEKIAFLKDLEVEIDGYNHLHGGRFQDEEDKVALLIRIYPQSVLTPKDILAYIDSSIDKLISTCTFDDDCYLLCKRLGIELLDKNYLLKHSICDIDEVQIEKEIQSEVMEIGEIKKRRKSSSFAKQRWSKYLMTGLLLIGISGFMGRFKIIYIAFGGMCMTFCTLSLLLSKPQ